MRVVVVVDAVIVVNVVVDVATGVVVVVVVVIVVVVVVVVVIVSINVVIVDVVLGSKLIQRNYQFNKPTVAFFLSTPQITTDSTPHHDNTPSSFSEEASGVTFVEENQCVVPLCQLHNAPARWRHGNFHVCVVNNNN